MGDKNFRWLALILAVAVLVRIGVAFYLGDVVDAPELLTDQRSYHALGARLLEGHGYSFGDNWYPFTLSGAPTAHWSFLYPLFITAVYALFGVHPLAARLAQAVLGGILLPWMVYRLARQVVSQPSPPGPLSHSMGEGAGGGGGGGEGQAIPVIAAAIAALYGYFVLYAATLMTETFYIAALLWSLEVSLRLGGRLRDGEDVPTGLGLQLGLSLGLAALLRQSVLPWVPVLVVWLLWQAWRGRVGNRPHPQPLSLSGRGELPPPPLRGRVGEGVAKPLIVAGLVLLACILPWTYRNYQVYGQFLLLNSNTGYAMYSAQHPMHGTSFREFDAAPLLEGWWGRPEPELDRDLMRLGIGFVLDDPARYLLLSLSRARAFFEFWPTPDTTRLHNIGRVASFGLLLPFILYGLYLFVRNSYHVTRNSLLLLFAVFYTVIHLFTWAMVRYRLPIDAVLIVLAAGALFDVYARGRRWLPVRGAVTLPAGPLVIDTARRGGGPKE